MQSEDKLCWTYLLHFKTRQILVFISRNLKAFIQLMRKFLFIESMSYGHWILNSVPKYLSFLYLYCYIFSDHSQQSKVRFLAISYYSSTHSLCSYIDGSCSIDPVNVSLVIPNKGTRVKWQLSVLFILMWWWENDNGGHIKRVNWMALFGCRVD